MVAQMPYWAVALVVLVLIVGYYLLTQQARERRRDKVGGDFAKVPNFYPNQTYTDVHGDAAIGIDDRGRRIAIARKNRQPRTRVYSFAHIISAEVVQNGRVIGSITPTARPPADSGKQPVLSQGAAPGDSVSAGGPPVDGLFGSTNRDMRPGISGPPPIRPELGQLTTAGVRVKFRNGESVDEVLIRFYDGKPVNVDGVEAERAFAEAKGLLGSLDVAVKRAGVPPRAPGGDVRV